MCVVVESWIVQPCSNVSISIFSCNVAYNFKLAKLTKITQRKIPHNLCQICNGWETQLCRQILDKDYTFLPLCKFSVNFIRLKSDVLQHEETTPMMSITNEIFLSIFGDVSRMDGQTTVSLYKHNSRKFFFLFLSWCPRNWHLVDKKLSNFEIKPIYKCQNCEICSMLDIFIG